MFTFAEWLGTASSVALNNLYHPGHQAGVAAATRNGVFVVLQDMGFDVLREFWPEVARRSKCPFAVWVKISLFRFARSIELGDRTHSKCSLPLVWFFASPRPICHSRSRGSTISVSA